MRSYYGTGLAGQWVHGAHGAGNRMSRLGKIRSNQLVGNRRATDTVALPVPLSPLAQAVNGTSTLSQRKR